MKSAEIGLLRGGAVAVLSVGTWAQEASKADPLKAQIDALNRIAGSRRSVFARGVVS